MHPAPPTPPGEPAAAVIAGGDPPPRLADYELVRRIGRGSYGDVWLARSITGAWRAVKIVWRERFAEPEPFEREFRGLTAFNATSFSSAGLLGPLHVGRDERARFFYYAMELADDTRQGRHVDPASYTPLTLKTLRALRGGRLPPGECVALGVELARALAELHAGGLLHRDIKRSNIILVNGVPKLADIGLVAETTHARTFVGTEGFVPPEGPGTPAADVFALGKVLYELVTGLDRAVFPMLPPELGDARERKAFFELNEILLRACAAEVGRRYASGAELLADLQALQSGRSLLQRRWRPVALGAGLALAAAVAVATSWPWLRREPAPPAAPAAATSDKSLVVLPLENLSPDPDNAFFTDGTHAEIIATLSRLPDLKVISRNSSLAFKGTNAALAALAQKLGVANVLLGSVRRTPDRVRIQLELRRASDEAILWAQTYEKEPRDALALQAEIAGEVARVLQARASTGYFSGARFTTKDPHAYDLMLLADTESRRSIAESGAQRWASFQKIIALCQEALRLDPDYSSAASMLSTNYVFGFGWETDPARRVHYAAEGRRWAEEAARLLPGGAGDGALAYYCLRVERDNQRCLALIENALRAAPNEATYHNRAALALDALGRAGEALPEFHRAIALDPVPLFMVNEIRLLARLRRTAAYAAAVANFSAVQTQLSAAASFPAQRYALFGELPDELAALPAAERVEWQWKRREFDRVVTSADAALADTALHDTDRLLVMLRRGQALKRARPSADAAGAAHAALALATQLQAVPETGPSEKQGWLAAALAQADQSDAAVLAARRFVEAASPTNQPLLRWEREIRLAEILAELGRAPECLALLAKLLRVPSGLTLAILRADPAWDPVRAEPGFQALLAEPKNAAPF